MNKNRIKLTESQLHGIIKESVINILSESSWGGKNVSSYHVDDEDDYCGTRIGDPKDNEYYQRQFDSISESDNYKGQTNGWRPDPNYTRKNGKATPKPSSSEYSKTNIEAKPFNTDEWQEQYRDNRGYKFSSKGSGPNKQWKREKVTESQLHNIIKESVKRVLKETRFDYIDLDPYEYDKMIDNDYRSRAQRAYDEIRNGVYDDMVPQWASGERDVYDDLDLDIDLGGEGLQDAVNDRNFVIDKSSALKYGQNPSDYPSSKKWHETNYPKDGNPNIKNRRNTSDVLSDEYWEDKEMRDTAKKYPHSFKKNGVMRNYDYDKGRIINFNKFRDNLEKDVYGTDQADKRPLHRKGSLNRAFDESIRRAIRKALR